MTNDDRELNFRQLTKGPPMTTDDTPRIYIADLAAYNAGRLRGAWVDADQDPEGMIEDWNVACGAMPEEYAIHDYEGFGKIKLAEFTGLDTVSQLASLIAEHGEAFTAWYEYEERPVDDNLGQQFLDEYVGTYENERDFAMSLADDTGCIETAIGSVALNGRDEEIINSYLDWHRVAQDLLIDSYYAVTSSDGVGWLRRYMIFVFRRI